MARRSREELIAHHEEMAVRHKREAVIADSEKLQEARRASKILRAAGFVSLALFVEAEIDDQVDGALANPDKAEAEIDEQAQVEEEPEPEKPEAEPVKRAASERSRA